MANNITPEMVALLNSGNKAELRAFLKLYTRPVYERALAITKNEADAIRVTRRVTSEISVLALRGKLEEDIDAQLMALTDSCCSEDIFFARLVEDTLRDFPDDANETPTLFGKAGKPKWPAKEQKELNTAPKAERSEGLAEPKQKREAAADARIDADDKAYNKQSFVYDGKQDGASIKSTPRLFEEDISENWEYEDGYDMDPEDEADRKPSVFIVLLIFIMALITLALVWVLVVKLMYMGIIPKADFGFAEWFNANLFRLY